MRRLLAPLLAASALAASETANAGLRIVPAPGAVRIDGQADDWDRSAAILVHGALASHRDRLGLWLQAMHDADHLYILALWRDPTPLDNPGIVSDPKARPWLGDCLQVRVAVAFEGVGGTERITHWNSWRDHDGTSVLGLTVGRMLSAARIPDALAHGATQAFSTGEAGYGQELALPWALLSDGGKRPAETVPLRLTVEACYTPEREQGDQTVFKDLFFPGRFQDRVTTFRSPECWAPAWLLDHGEVRPLPIPLADGTQLDSDAIDGAPEGPVP